MMLGREPKWMPTARRYIGLQEIVGPKHSSVIVGWLRKLNAWWANDEQPWCGTYVAAVFHEHQVALPKHWYRARAWLDWGDPIPHPVPGCIVVFERGGGGHVAFAVGRDTKGRLICLGGNQGNAVSIAPFTLDRVIGYRWPNEAWAQLEYRDDGLPLLASNAASSTGEA
jgi:uncharacterized protein (TIGR02594 family)